jgi:hypothetical protein
MEVLIKKNVHFRSLSLLTVYGYFTTIVRARFDYDIIARLKTYLFHKYKARRTLSSAYDTLLLLDCMCPRGLQSNRKISAALACQQIPRSSIILIKS